MATVVERPMSALSDMQDTIQRPRRDPIEIIDVDLFEPAASTSQAQSSVPSRPRPRMVQRRLPSHPETINLLDSDDDEADVQSLASRVLAGHGVDRNRSHRFFISPPPRAHTPIVIPPTPPVPARYSGHIGLPMSRHPPPFPSPPVVPNAEPFEFEEVYPEQSDAGLSNPRRAVAPQASSVSHHTPAMGFGGALISTNRNQAQAPQRELHRQRQAMQLHRRDRQIRPSGLHRHPNNTRRIHGSPTNASAFLNRLPNLHHDPDQFQVNLPRIHMIGAAHVDPHAKWDYFRHMKEKDYLPHFTHPEIPEPGYTFDFGQSDEDVPHSRIFPPTSIHDPIILDDNDDNDDDKGPKPDNGPSGSQEPVELNALLVCAKCFDPLILNTNELDPEEAQLRRVWAMRCGHMIDQKCLNALSFPKDGEEPPNKGKKGKGKIKAQPPLIEAPEVEEPSDIRSRLRSRNSAFIPPPPEPSTQSFHDALPRRRRAPNRKPKVEGFFVWSCPVKSCNKTNVSVKIDGKWGPQKEPLRGFGKDKDMQFASPRGAVPVFA